jgi:hypothetical protein
VLFHSPPGVLFTFPSRYWSTIGRSGSLALEGGPPGFPRGFPCPAVLGWQNHAPGPPFAYGAVTPCGRPSQVVRLDGPRRAAGLQPRPSCSRNPGPATLAGSHAGPVWAPPRSLATTEGISFDFLSSRY